MLVAVSSPLTRLIPGLMIWTIIFFVIVFIVLRKFAFSAIQKLIDERRESIRRAIESAEEARDEAQKLLEEHRKLIAEARGQGETILAEARQRAQKIEDDGRIRHARLREETRLLEERVEWAREGLREVTLRLGQVFGVAEPAGDEEKSEG
jgi:F-type H+-transporting ATPase subunit b